MLKRKLPSLALLVTLSLSLASSPFSYGRTAAAAPDETPPVTPAAQAEPIAARGIPGEDVFPIAAFFMPTWPHTNEQQYDFMKDAHINLLQTFYPNDTGFKDISQMMKVLDLSKDRGITVQVSDSRTGALMSSATDEEIDAIAKTYKDHPATGGYYIKDEPNFAELPRAAHVYKRFLYADPDSISNVNLFPNLNWPGKSYATYLKTWVEEADARNLKYLTMDRYPFLTTQPGKVDAGYFPDIRDLRSVGLQSHLNTALYLQSVGLPEASMRRTNENELRWHVYSSLAFGLKGLYWFTWFQPVITNHTFSPAIIDKDGRKTDLYEPAKQLGKEITTLGPTLMGLTSVNVFVNGTVPAGTTKLPADYFVSPASNDDLMVSHFTNAAGRDYVMIMNRDLAATKDLTINWPLKPASLTEVSKETGLETAVNYNSSTGALQASFLPGEGKLFVLPQGAEVTRDTTVPHTESALMYLDTWTTVPASDGFNSAHSTDRNHASVEHVFVGDRIELIAETGPTGGDVDIYIDNVLDRTISTKTDARLASQTVYSKQDLAKGVHTIKVVKKPGGKFLLEQFKVHFSAGPIVTIPRAPAELTGTTQEGAQTLNWQQVNGNVSGYNVYRALSPTAEFTKLNSSPLTTTTFTDSKLSQATKYYYKVTAANGVGESKFSKILTVETPFYSFSEKLQSVIDQLELQNGYANSTMEGLKSLPSSFFIQERGNNQPFRLYHYLNNQERPYFLLANDDPSKESTLNLQLPDKPSGVVEISSETGLPTTGIHEYNANSGNLTVTLPAGGAKLFTVSTDLTHTEQTMINDDDSGFKYVGFQTSRPYARNIGNYMDDIHYSGKKGDSLTYTFTGTGVDVVVELDRNGSDLEIYLDDVFQGTVTTFESGAVNKVMRTVYSKHDLPKGTHTLKAVHGKANSGDPYIFFEGLRIHNKIEIQITSPAAPLILSSEQTGAEEATLTWNASEPSIIDSYDIYRANQQDGEFVKLNQLPVLGGQFVDQGLETNHTYYYKVVAVNASGVAESSPVQIVVSALPALPEAPVDVTATASGENSISLSWTAVEHADSYNVFRSASADGEYVQVNAQPVTSTTFADSELSAGTTYYYKVAAVNSVGQSIQSEAVSATTDETGGPTEPTVPAVPAGLTAAANGQNSINLSWTAVERADSYNVFRAGSTDGEYVLVNAQPITGTTFADSELSAGTIYYYKVSAVNSAGQSTQSEAVSATTDETGGPTEPTVPAVPAGLTAAANGQNSISLSWTAVERADSYNVFRSASADGEYVQVNAQPVTSTTFADSELSAGTTYYYKVSAVNSAGQSTQSEAVSATTDETGGPTEPTIPAVPAGLTAAANGQNSINLSWTAVAHADSYNVFRAGSADGEYVQVNSQPVTGTTFADSGLTSGGTYYYKLSAVNAAGESARSAVVSATTDYINVWFPNDQNSVDNGTKEEPKQSSTVVNNVISVTSTAGKDKTVHAVITAEDVKRAASDDAGHLSIVIKEDEHGAPSDSFEISLPVQSLLEGFKHITITAGGATVTLSAEQLHQGNVEKSSQLSVQITKKSTSDSSDAVRQLAKEQVEITLLADGQPVALKEGLVTLELPYVLKANERAHQTVAYWIGEDGIPQLITNSTYDAATGLVSFKPSQVGSYVVVNVNISFSDLNHVSWAQTIIESLAARNLVHGIGDGQFAPQRPVTRAEFVKLIVDVLQLTSTNTSSPFTDVASDAWYSNAVAIAAQLNIVNGLSDGSFAAERIITREEMAVILQRAALAAGITLAQKAASKPTDENAISSYAADAVSELYQAAVLNGFEDGSFKPSQPASRAEAAVVIYRLLQQK